MAIRLKIDILVIAPPPQKKKKKGKGPSDPLVDLARRKKLVRKVKRNLF